MEQIGRHKRATTTGWRRNGDGRRFELECRSQIAESMLQSTSPRAPSQGWLLRRIPALKMQMQRPRQRAPLPLRNLYIHTSETPPDWKRRVQIGGERIGNKFYDVSDDTYRTRFTDATSQIYRQESLFTPVSSVESSLLTGLHPSSLDSAFSDLHSLPHTVSLSTRFFSKSLGHSPSLGPHPSSLDSPIPDLHSVPSGVPWATPFKPRFSDPRSPLGPFSPLGRALAASILHSAISTPSLPPLGRALAASILHSAICTHSCCPLGRALAASILRSPICTRSVAPWAARPSIFHSPISDLHSQATSQREFAVSRDGALVTRA